jgi:hypothetical protein
VALDHGVEEHHDGDLEEGGDQGRETGTLAAVAVEPRAREQQQHHQAGERRVLLRLVEGQVQRVRRPQGRLDRERSPDRKEHAGHVEAGERRDPRSTTQQLEAQHALEHRHAPGAHVARGRLDRLRRLQLSQLSRQAVPH